MHKRPWIEDENEKLRRLAGKVHRVQIAEQLGRSLGAIDMQASKLGIALRMRSKLFPEGDVVNRNQSVGGT